MSEVPVTPNSNAAGVEPQFPTSTIRSTQPQQAQQRQELGLFDKYRGAYITQLTHLMNSVISKMSDLDRSLENATSISKELNDAQRIWSSFYNPVEFNKYREENDDDAVPSGAEKDKLNSEISDGEGGSLLASEVGDGEVGESPGAINNDKEENPETSFQFEGRMSNIQT